MTVAPAAGLIPYVPRLALDWAARFGDTQFCVLEGSMVFIDLSGFTALSERLSRLGREGAEQVTDVINATFTDLLEAAYAAGGSLLKFGGDALLLFFEGDGHGPRAAHAAHAMRARLRRRGPAVTPAGKATLRMSVGAHSGEFNFFLVGEHHRELIVTGPGATMTASMEGAASAGQILCSPATAELLPARCRGQSLGPGVLLASAPAIVEQDFVPVDQHVDPRPFVPEALRSVVEAGGAEAEHRAASVAFVHFDGTDALITAQGPAAVADRLHRLVLTAQRALRAHDLCFLSTDLDKDGGKLILTGGVPTAHEDDEDRLLRAVRAIVDGDHGLSVRAGVHRGPLFAGEVGPDYRRTYTIMGDTVNTAARVMAHAKAAEALATPAFLRGVRALVEQQPIEPFAAKGKARPLEASRVGAVFADHVESALIGEGPLVGRDEELAVLRSWVDSPGDEGSAMTVVGEPGSGKSHLVAALARDCTRPVTILRGDAFQSAVPYAPLRAQLRAWMGVGDRPTAHELATALGHDGAHGAPFLGRALGLDGEGLGAIAKDMPPAAIRQRTNAAIRSIAPLEEPRVIIVEDAQHLDQDTGSFLTDLLGTASAWRVLLIARPDSVSLGAQLVVGPLSDDAAEKLALATAEGQIERGTVRQLVRRADGNPLLLVELIRSVVSGRSPDDLPENLEKLGSTAIDRLPPVARRQLRYLSVLGSRFSRDLAEATLQAPMSDELSAFVRVGPDGWEFRQTLYRDAAYAGLPYRTRRQRHLDAARHLSGVPGAGFVTAMHLHAGAAWADAWTHARGEADAAVRRASFAEAVALLEWAAEAGEKVGTVTRGDVARAWTQLANYRLLLGQSKGAVQAAAQATRRATEPELVVQLCHINCMLRGANGQSIAAVRWARRGLRLSMGATDPEMVRLRHRLQLETAILDTNRGRFSSAITTLQSCLREAEERGDLAGAAHACSLLMAALSKQRAPEASAYGERAAQLYAEAGAEWMLGAVHVQVGNHLRSLGRLDEAAAQFTLALDRLQHWGTTGGIAIVENNIGELHADLGNLDDADRYFFSALATFDAMGHVFGEVVKVNIGRVAVRRAHHELAEHLFADAGKRLRDAGLADYAEEATLRLAESLLLRSGLDDAAAALAGAHPESASLRVLHDRLRALLLALRGDREAAVAHIEGAIARAEQAELPFEAACSLAALALLTGSEDASQRSKEIFDRLGVVEAPPLPTIGEPQSAGIT